LDVHRRLYDLSLSGLQFKMRYRITYRLEKAGATSKEKAVTIEEAELTLQEQQWLSYFSGGLFSEIKKTEDKRYYI
jgi:hypothetical protein